LSPSGSWLLHVIAAAPPTPAARASASVHAQVKTFLVIVKKALLAQIQG
jgi:hypothetical protein